MGLPLKEGWAGLPDGLSVRDGKRRNWSLCCWFVWPDLQPSPASVLLSPGLPGSPADVPAADVRIRFTFSLHFSSLVLLTTSPLKMPNAVQTLNMIVRLHWSGNHDTQGLHVIRRLRGLFC